MGNNTYVKLPVEVEAFRMTEAMRWDNSDWPEWLHVARNTDPQEAGSLFIDLNDQGGSGLSINTLEGAHHVTCGDWIIKGIRGELCPCKHDIFMASYKKKDAWESTFCIWNEDIDGNFHSSCGREFFLGGDHPNENGGHFCPNCGKGLVEQIYVEPNGETTETPTQ